MKKIFKFLVLVLACGLVAVSLPAQTPTPPATADYQPLSSQQLDQLLGPIALYPDPLIAEILPASTLPTQIVLADRYISGGGDTNEIAQQPWDPSVQALAHYPLVLKWLDDNLNWTTVLGDAFLNQQPDVMNSIQRLRAKAQNLGNLQSTPQQQVVDDSGDIEIVPADPDMMYVPNYYPDQVYFESPYGTPFITFGIGFGIGWWLNGDFDWAHGNLIWWNRDHPRPANWWHERGDRRYSTLVNNGTVWRPGNRPGVGSASRGDRGWNYSNTRRSVPALNHIYGRPTSEPNARLVPINNNRPAINQPVINRYPGSAPDQHFTAPAEHFAPVSRPPSDTFIGIQSPQETRSFSDRGEQSMQTMPRSEPESRPESSFHSGGGGGGGHGGGGGGGRR
jgi:hypothetical protein